MPKQIATHNKVFHADEVTAIALLKVFTNDEIDIHRVEHNTTDFSKYDMVIDIGRRFDGVKFFDHHQYQGGKSSAGLIWDYLALSEDYPSISNLIELVDKNDTGEAKAKPYEYSSLIKYFNKQDIYSKEQDEAFLEAVKFAETILSSLKAKDEAKKEAKEIIKNSNKFENFDGIIELKEFTPFWSSFINGKISPKVKAVVWHDKKENNYKIRVAPKEKDSFELNFKPLPQSKIMDFVHSNGFFAIAKDRETLVRYLKDYYGNS